MSTHEYGERLARLEEKLDSLPDKIGFTVLRALEPVQERLDKHERDLNFWKWTQRTLGLAWGAVLAYIGLKNY